MSNADLLRRLDALEREAQRSRANERSLATAVERMLTDRGQPVPVTVKDILA
jgi:hypothetical protein